MLQRFFETVLSAIARAFFGQGEHRPMFDLDEIFDRLGDAGDRFIGRAQKIMVGYLSALILGTLALSVLTVRIYQLSADTTVNLLGLSVDGAILFGIILVAIAGAVAYFVFRDQKNSMEAPRAPRAEQRELPSPRAPSPLEEALATLILHHLGPDRMAAGPQAPAGEPVTPAPSPSPHADEAWRTPAPTSANLPQT